jgi:hypothetical protein
MNGKFLRNIEGETGRDRIRNEICRNEIWIQNLLARVKKETIRKVSVVFPCERNVFNKDTEIALGLYCDRNIF